MLSLSSEYFLCGCFWNDTQGYVMSNTHAHMHIVKSFLIKPCLFIYYNFQLHTTRLIQVLVIFKVLCSSLELFKTILLLDWEVARFCLPLSSNLLLCCYFAFERATHWAWRGESLCELPVWNINAFLLGKLPTGWGTSCSAHTIPTSARLYLEGGGGLGGGWVDREREWDLWVIHIYELLYKSVDFSVI